MKPVRRVVTGHTPEGRSTIVFDSEQGTVVDARRDGSRGLIELWSTGGSPADNSGNDDAARAEYRLLPDSGGSVLRLFEIQAGAAPRFHTTDTVDYLIVLEGEVVAVMEEGETLLRQGDVLIQRGTHHAWTNRSDRPCRLAAVMLDAAPVPGRASSR